MSSSSAQGERRKAKVHLSSSTSQQERKREIDRRSQRNARERAKAYIAQLENENETLLKLSRQAGDVQLIEQLRDQSDENERLRSSMRQISAIAMSSGGVNATVKEQTSSSRRPVGQAMASAERNVVAANSTPAVNTGSPRISSVSRPAESKPMLACGDGERDYFGTANGAILFMEAACMGLPCPDPDEDEDIILCAAFHGWDVASSKHVLDAGWQLLQLFDEGLFFRSETVERVVIMRILRSMSLIATRQNVTDRQKPPPYMEPTELQKSVPHARLADYYFWPSIRDFFVSTGFTKISEKLSAQFARDVGFHWAFEARDIALRDKTTGRYKFSQDFNKAFADPSNWYIKSERTAVYFPAGSGAAGGNASSSDVLDPASYILVQYGMVEQPFCDAGTSTMDMDPTSLLSLYSCSQAE